MRIVLADREAELMGILWEHGPATVTEVRERLADPLAYTSVLTMLRNLEAKGYVTHSAEGRSHRFAARISREAAQRTAVRDLARKMFKGSAAMLMTHLVDDARLSDDDVERLRALLDQRARQSRPR